MENGEWQIGPPCRRKERSTTSANGDEKRDEDQDTLFHTLHRGNDPALFAVVSFLARAWSGYLSVDSAALRKQGLGVFWPGRDCVVTRAMGLCLLRGNQIENASSLDICRVESPGRGFPRVTAISADAPIKARSFSVGKHRALTRRFIKHRSSSRRRSQEKGE
jgi:hypothetical protein